MRNTHTHAHTHIGVRWWKEDCVSIPHNTLEACWSNPCDDRALACDDHLGYKQEALYMQFIEYQGGSAANFFLPTTSSPLTGFARVALFRSRAIEGWRGVVRSMPMCIDAIDVYTYGEDIYRVCLRIIRMDVTYGLERGVRYIYLISMFYNAVDTVIYI